MKLVEINDGVWINPDQVVSVYLYKPEFHDDEVRVLTVDCTFEKSLGWVSKFSIDKTVRILSAN